MTRIERAWGLFMLMRQDYQAGPSPQLANWAFDQVDAFEREAAKHEAPKSELYCIGWSQGVGRIQIEGEAEPRELADARLKEINQDLSDNDDPFFLVEVRRVK